jgi:orotidine-5'-phosphate decarboxylase
MHIERSDSKLRSPIILAVDTDDLEVAKKWVSATSASVGVYKLGLEFFLKFGRDGIAAVQGETDSQIFLDLKLHDIPNTVGAAASQVASLKPKFLTVHASGGSAMVKAAVENAPDTDITAVTILTSLNQSDLINIGFNGSPEDRAVELAKLAVVAGARAIVCSPLEISSVRSHLSNSISIITPGIRPRDKSSSDDQKRVMDPKSAIKAGANYLVIGRPITGAVDVSRAAAEILEEALS